MMSRSFTKREKILLLCLAILFLAVVYIKLVYLDVEDVMAQHPVMMSEAQMELEIEQQRSIAMNRMKAELESIEASGEKLQMIPDYDNSEKVMKELNKILVPVKDYSLSFLPLEQEGNVIRRKISLSFKCPSYTSAEQVVRNISDMECRNLITSLSITNSGSLNTNDVVVSLSATFFEISETTVVADINK